jgi:IclR family mhp operon transcriptional activator
MAKTNGRTMDGAERLLQVIRAMNENGPVSALDLNRLTKISRPAIYRLVEILIRNGYVRRIPDQTKFELTSEIKLLSSGFRGRNEIAEIARPIMAKLKDNILWPMSLAAFDRGSMIVLETTRYTSPFVFDDGSVGFRVPILKSALGLAYFSFVSAQTREIILELLTQSTDKLDAVARKPAEVDRLVKETKRRGYGLRQGGNDPRTCSIAVPIVIGDEAQASICVTFGRTALSEKNAVNSFLTLLRGAAAEIGSGIKER